MMDNMRITSVPPRMDIPIEHTTIFFDSFGLDGYKDCVDKAIRRYANRVNGNAVNGYGELSFDSYIRYDGISDARLYSIHNGFVCINIHSVHNTGVGFEVVYSLMPSCKEIIEAKGKYHLVPRVKKFKDYFDLITFDVELD